MKVLVAIDDSPYTEYLSDTIVARKWPEDTQFRILSVVQPLDHELIKDLSFNARQEILERSKQHAENLAEKVRHKIAENVAHASVYFEVRQGEPQTQIIESATDWGADTIMLGAKGRQACPLHLLGSVSRGVASHAGCSVEIVREPVKPEKAKAKSTCAAGKSRKR